MPLTPLHDDDLDPRFYWQARLPTTWAAGAWTTGDLIALNDSNQTLFQALAAIETATTANDGEESSVPAADVHRLDIKMNLVLAMLSRLMAHHALVPTVHEVVLADRFVVWRDAPIWQPGDQGVLDVFIDPLLALPLRLPMSIDEDGRGLFDGLTASSLQGIERFLFRQHRRDVAVSKQQQRS